MTVDQHAQQTRFI